MAGGLSDMGVGHAYAPGRGPDAMVGESFFDRTLFWVRSLDQTETLAFVAIALIILSFAAFSVIRMPARSRQSFSSARDERPDLKDRAEIAAAVKRMRDGL
ncbi:MAG: hypothetical protein AAF371_20205 [Pseudomonadota bacterium]